jgi:predicted DCC family thiol-disulfide oxidoreductase YuxK
MKRDTVFFDDGCSFCRDSVRWVKDHDAKKRFVFKPLRDIPEYLNENSVVLREKSGRVWLRGRAALRILWLIGGRWKWLGFLHIVPLLPDLIYRLIAHARKG